MFRGTCTGGSKKQQRLTECWVAVDACPDPWTCRPRDPWTPTSGRDGGGGGGEGDSPTRPLLSGWLILCPGAGRSEAKKQLVSLKSISKFGPPLINFFFFPEEELSDVGGRWGGGSVKPPEGPIPPPKSIPKQEPGANQPPLICITAAGHQVPWPAGSQRVLIISAESPSGGCVRVSERGITSVYPGVTALPPRALQGVAGVEGGLGEGGSPPPPLPKCSISARAVLKGPDFFFLLRTALKDRPKGPPTANRQLPSTANRHQPPTTNRHQPPPTASGDQPPTANHCQPPPTTNHQPPTTTNRHQPPVANHQPPPTMVEHMECPRAFLGKLVPEHLFFPPLRTALISARNCEDVPD